MNLDNITSILRAAFNLNPLAKSMPLEPQTGIILYSIASDQTPVVILKKSSETDSIGKWEIPQNLDEFNDILMNSKSEPLLTKLSEDRIESLNQDGTIGAIRLMPAECRVVESYLHRHWQSDKAPSIEIFRLTDFMDFRLKELSQANQKDILVRFHDAFKAKSVMRELELILG